MRKPPKYYLRNISRRWHTEIKKVDEKVIIICPYLTSKAEAILRGSKFAECEVYTIFSVRNFVCGSSSLKTLQYLYKRGCKLYHLPKLHAKIIISPGKFATIGSQNITRNGIKSKEASVIFFEEEEVKKIEKMLDEWFPERKPITFEMLKQLEDQIIRLRKKFNLVNSELNTEINNLEKEIWENQNERNEQLFRKSEEFREAEEAARILKELELRDILRIQHEEQILQEEQNRQKEQWREIVNNARNKVQQLSTNGMIEQKLAEEFIENCAYFKIVTLARARNDVKQIRKEGNNWLIYKKNSFSISYAIYNCQQTLLEFLEKAEFEYVMPKAQVREKLERIVQEAVVNSNGNKYKNYTGVDGDFIKFGNHCISISNFVSLILSKSGIDDPLFEHQGVTKAQVVKES